VRKRGDTVYAPSPRSSTKWETARFLGKSARGNDRVVWTSGKLKGREALLSAKTIRSKPR